MKKARELGRQKEKSVVVVVTSDEVAKEDSFGLVFWIGSWAGAGTGVAAAGTIAVCTAGASLVVAVSEPDSIDAALIAIAGGVDGVVDRPLDLVLLPGVVARTPPAEPKLVNSSEASAAVSDCNELAAS